MSQTSLAVLSHWGTMVENMQASPLEFYTYVEHAIKKREIPDVRIERITLKESGILSADREYLRVSRGLYRYDICAAPFGTGFFFSSWMVERSPPPVLALVAILIFPFVALWLFILFVYFGGVLGFTMWGGGLVAGFIFLIVTLGRDESVIADHIFVVPYIGPILQKAFRPDTYFRSDTEAMFRAMAHNSVLEAVDATTKEKGAREVTGDERKPVMRDFFKR